MADEPSQQPRESAAADVIRLPYGHAMLAKTPPLRLRRRLLVGSFAVGLAGLAGCGSDGTVDVENNGPTAVTVAFGDEVDFGEVAPSGGGLVYTDDCLQGPIVVTFKSGRVVELAETACPGQRLLVRGESAMLVTQSNG